MLCLACLFLPFGPAAAARAEQLPFRNYGPADGLGGSLVRAIYQDHKGYVWLGASDGLSRFDGHSFINDGVRDGLPVPASTPLRRTAGDVSGSGLTAEGADRKLASGSAPTPAQPSSRENAP